jgi:hypothetical protein
VAKGSSFFFGETQDRDKAFLGIKSIDIIVEQDLWAMASRDGKPTVHRYTKDTVPRYERCINRLCQQGGLDLQQLILFGSTAEPATIKCSGHEGSPQGRRKGRNCDNFFRVTISIETTQASPLR